MSKRQIYAVKAEKRFDMKICPKCQAECEDDVKFCPKCGEGLTEVEPVKEQVPEERPSFCPFCGKPLDADATFCPGCGSKIGSKTQSGAPAIFVDFVNTGKDFFTKGPVVAAQNGAKSKGISWILYASLAIITFMFAAATNIHQFFYFGFTRAMLTGVATEQRAQLRKNIVDGIDRSVYKFGLGLLFSFLLGTIVFFTFAFAIFVATKIMKKNVSLMSVFNLVGVASIPITLVSIINLIVGIIWAPLSILFLGTAVIVSLYLMFTGIDSLADFEGKGANVMFFAITIAAFVISIFLMLFFGISANNYFFGRTTTA